MHNYDIQQNYLRSYRIITFLQAICRSIKESKIFNFLIKKKEKKFEKNLIKKAIFSKRKEEIVCNRFSKFSLI